MPVDTMTIASQRFPQRCLFTIPNPLLEDRIWCPPNRKIRTERTDNEPLSTELAVIHQREEQSADIVCPLRIDKRGQAVPGNGLLLVGYGPKESPTLRVDRAVM